jgi:hypothetical protein
MSFILVKVELLILEIPSEFVCHLSILIKTKYVGLIESFYPERFLSNVAEMCVYGGMQFLVHDVQMTIGT